ncbi:MAG: hypothetical protein JWR35_1149 [Marmoricola sp.]|nr:hypothetical protein [Marmoricola sp.]
MTGDLGVAVQSRFLAIGATSSFASADVGAVATQALTNVSYGPRALDLLAAGTTATRTLDVLLQSDVLQDRRQAAVVDVQGRVAVHTGSGCAGYAGHVTGPGFSCQGNMLVSHDVVHQMATVMSDEGSALPERMLAALLAGQEAGGDARGQQSASLLVARQDGGYGGLSDRLVDLRVDDHATPILELQRLLGLHRLYFDKPDEDAMLPLGPLVDEIAQRLVRLSHVPASTSEDAVWDALDQWSGRENLEERMTRRGHVDPTVLACLRRTDEVGEGH